MMSCTSWKIGVAAATALFAACTSDSLHDLGSVHVKSANITPAGGTIAVSAEEHAELAGTQIVIPAGALEQDTKITINTTPASINDDEDSDPSGPGVELGPSGTRFKAKVRITLPFTGEYDEDLVRIYQKEDDGTLTVLFADSVTYDAVAKTVSFEAEHFTRFQSRRARGRCRNVNCQTNTCRRGRCLPPPPATCDNLDEARCLNTPGCRPVYAQCACPAGLRAPCSANDPNCQNGCPATEPNCQTCDCSEPVYASCSPIDPVCGANECGPQPGLPNYQCPDGSLGGPTGRCIRSQAGQCGWEIRDCPPPPPPQCDANACGPRPALPNYVCSDGTIAGPTGRCIPIPATQSNDRLVPPSECGWEIIECPRPPPTPCDTIRCPQGTQCNPQTGSCDPSGGACGNNVCANDQYCCNPSCGICAPIGGACTEQACNDRCGPDGACPQGTRCDVTNNTCVREPVGCANGAPCPQGTYCERTTNQCVQDAACGANVPCPQGSVCDPNTRQCVREPVCSANGTTCPAGTRCDATNNQCVREECDPARCGPALDAPTWICEDGSTGGNTGRCILQVDPAGQTVCGWEMVNCPRQCDRTECGPQPGLPNYQCQDGTVGGPTGECRRAPDGTCAWEIRRCQ